MGPVLLFALSPKPNTVPGTEKAQSTCVERISEQRTELMEESLSGEESDTVHLNTMC